MYNVAGLDAAGGRDGEAGGPGPGSMSWQELVDDVRGTLLGEVWRVMSPEFYISFWSLSYQDIFVPADRCAVNLLAWSHHCRFSSRTRN